MSDENGCTCSPKTLEDRLGERCVGVCGDGMQRNIRTVGGGLVESLGRSGGGDRGSGYASLGI